MTWRGSSWPEAIVGPDGSIYTGAHRLGPDGGDLPFRPYRTARPQNCYAPVFGSDGTGYVLCGHVEGGGAGLIAFDAHGAIEPGWPLFVGGEPIDAVYSRPRLAVDGTIFVMTATEISAVAPDGRRRSGWPKLLENLDAVGAHVLGYLLGPDGDVTVWWFNNRGDDICAPPGDTIITRLDEVGRTLPGWPLRSPGYSPEMALGPDGSLHFATPEGRLWAYDRLGRARDGWPIAVTGAECPGLEPMPVYVAPDGTVNVMSSGLLAIAPDGKTIDGWPYRPKGSLTCSTPDTPTAVIAPAPAYGQNGTTYVAVFDEAGADWTCGDPAVPGGVVTIVLLDRQGRVEPGWPVPVTRLGPGIFAAKAPDGRSFVALATEGPWHLVTVTPRP